MVVGVRFELRLRFRQRLYFLSTAPCRFKYVVYVRVELRVRQFKIVVNVYGTVSAVKVRANVH